MGGRKRKWRREREERSETDIVIVRGRRPPPPPSGNMNGEKSGEEAWRLSLASPPFYLYSFTFSPFVYDSGADHFLKECRQDKKGTFLDLSAVSHFSKKRKKIPWPFNSE